MAKSLRSLSPASPSFSATRTVGLASRPEETKTTRERVVRRLGRRETEKAEERGSLDERESEGGEIRRVWEVALAAMFDV